MTILTETKAIEIADHLNAEADDGDAFKVEAKAGGFVVAAFDHGEFVLYL